MRKHIITLISALSALAALSSCTSYVDVNLSAYSATIISKNLYHKATDELICDFNAVLKEPVILEKETLNVLDKKDMAQMLGKNSSNPILDISEDGKRYKVNINIDNYQTLGEIFPLLNDENVAIYTAKYNENEDEDSFLEIIDYVFGTGIKDALRESYVTIKLRSDDEITSTQGCKKIDDNTIELDISLLNFALLKSPITFGFTTK